MSGASIPWSSPWRFAGHTPGCSYHHWAGGPRTEHSTPRVCHQSWKEGENQFSWTADNLSLTQPGMLMASMAATVHCWLRITLFCARTHRSFKLFSFPLQCCFPAWTLCENGCVHLSAITRLLPLLCAPGDGDSQFWTQTHNFTCTNTQKTSHLFLSTCEIHMAKLL